MVLSDGLSEGFVEFCQDLFSLSGGFVRWFCQGVCQVVLSGGLAGGFVRCFRHMVLSGGFVRWFCQVVCQVFLSSFV